ncbi:MAG: ATP-binding protein [Pseudomonadota bacterium]
MSELAPNILSSPTLDQVRALLEGSVDAAVVLDGERRILYFNQAYQQASGKRGRSLAVAAENRQRCYEVFPLEICEQACLGCRALKAGRSLRVDEIQGIRGDGEEITLIVVAAPLADGCIVETYRDVTADVRIQRKYKLLLERERRANETLEKTVLERTEELRAANEQLRRTQAQLIHQEKMSSLGRLVAGIAHELNNPINFVYGNVDFLGRYVEDILSLIDLYDRAAARLSPEERSRIEAKKQEIEFDYLVADSHKLIRSIRAGAERTAGIVRDLKTFSRAGGGEMQDTDIVAGIETTLNLLAPLLKDRITVVREFGTSIPRIVCHPGHINQVFMNILTNAAQAIRGKGHIYIDVNKVPDTESVRIKIRDTGPGILPDVIGKVFDPFFTTKEVGEGTGLGLAISESIVTAHGGTLACESSEGQGAAFTVTLPIKPPPERRA